MSQPIRPRIASDVAIMVAVFILPSSVQIALLRFWADHSWVRNGWTMILLPVIGLLLLIPRIQSLSAKVVVGLVYFLTQAGILLVLGLVLMCAWYHACL